MNQQVVTTRGDADGKIDDLICFLNEAKAKGATHYKMIWSGDPMWALKWFETYRIKSDQEQKEEEIASLKQRLKQLREKK